MRVTRGSRQLASEACAKTFGQLTITQAMFLEFSVLTEEKPVA